MNLRDRKKLYRKAINKWGLPLQLNVLMEECAELIQATSKIIRGDDHPDAWKQLAEEMADVEIMIEQIKLTTDWQLTSERVEAAREEKLLRVKKWLEAEPE